MLLYSHSKFVSIFDQYGRMNVEKRWFSAYLTPVTRTFLQTTHTHSHKKHDTFKHTKNRARKNANTLLS